MTIKQLIDELSNYDPELEVRVWCAHTDTDHEIDQATQGYTDGTLDTYVSICIEGPGYGPAEYDANQSHDYPCDARAVDRMQNEWKERGME